MLSDPATILLACADERLATKVAEPLRADGHHPVVTPSHTDALDALAGSPVDLAVVCLALPERPADFELIRALRSPDAPAPDLPLLAVGDGYDQLDCLRAFELGCDDYLGELRSILELRARIAALLRRARPTAREGRLRVGPLTLDPATREARVHGQLVHLTRLEFALLHHLAADPTRVHTKQELLRAVWGFQDPVPTRTLDSHACRLRAKLAQHDAQFVVAVWGTGYRLTDTPPQIGAIAA